ncbi:MAG: hypothetical protein A2046_15675 [Bacteroidetes bacterium GWA2_30_7]|nr:MAG: hypothetical protein A2046_15675 [Bacteroidetes bacterium GWA2_30_7]
MKTSIFLIGIFIINLPAFSQTQELKPTETGALANVLVTNMSDKPSKGDKVSFIGKKTGKIVSGVTKSNGKFSVLIPKGDTYEIKCQSFENDDKYSTVEIPNLKGNMSFDVVIKYELPKVYRLENVYFDTGKSSLKPESFISLNNLAELLQYKEDMIIEISGHTDDVGDDNANQKLSEERAVSVKKYLIKKGIFENRIISIGYGESQPIAYNSDSTGRQQNRRTEVRIIKE